MSETWSPRLSLRVWFLFRGVNLWDPLFIIKGEKNVLKQFIFLIFVTIKTHIVIGDLLTDPQVMRLNVIGSSCGLFFQLPLHLWVACGQILGHEMEMEVCWRWWGRWDALWNCCLSWYKRGLVSAFLYLTHLNSLPNMAVMTGAMAASLQSGGQGQACWEKLPFLRWITDEQQE